MECMFGGEAGVLQPRIFGLLLPLSHYQAK